jgi:hypothetical protein
MKRKGKEMETAWAVRPVPRTIMMNIDSARIVEEMIINEFIMFRTTAMSIPL